MKTTPCQENRSSVRKDSGGFLFSFLKITQLNRLIKDILMKTTNYSAGKIAVLLALYLKSVAFSLLAQGRSEFIIGADWLYNPPRPDYSNIVPSPTDWANISALGLNWGMLAMPPGDEHISKTKEALDSSTVKLILFRYQFSAFTEGKRWVYHPEYVNHYPGTGTIGDPFLHDYPGNEPASGTRDPDDTGNNYNVRRVRSGINPSGYIARNLILRNEQPDSVNYYLKIRMRLSSSVPFTHTPVIVVRAVRLSDGAARTYTVYADEFGDYNYKEITTVQFYKSPSGSMVPLQGLDERSTGEVNPFGIKEYATGRFDAQRTSETYAEYDYQIYWPGQVSCYIDYIAVDDHKSHQLFTGANNNLITGEVTTFKGYENLGKFKINDEPIPSQWPGIGYVEQQIKTAIAPNHPSKSGFHYNTGYFDGYGDPDRMIRRNIIITANNQTAGDIYPFKSYSPLPDDPYYTQSTQEWLQSYLVSKLKLYIQHANEYRIPFWYQAQAHSWEEMDSLGQWILLQREPTVWELRATVNLALAYGAKGIKYFLHRSVNDEPYKVRGNGLVDVNGVPRTTIYPGTFYVADKWEHVKSINQQLAILGPVFSNLAWQDAISRHQLGASFVKFNLLLGGNLTNVVTNDVVTQRFVEVGYLRGGGRDYLFVVNRRTAPSHSRSITMSFNNNKSWKITEVASGNSWVIGANGSFSDSFSPGFGKLYRVELNASPPSDPTISIGASGNHPKLSWSAVSGADSYRIYRGATYYLNACETASFAQIGSTSQTTFTDNQTILEPISEDKACYYVTSYSNQTGESGPSNIVSTRALVPYNNRDELISAQMISFPTEYTVDDNYPNPFNPTTTIHFGLLYISDYQNRHLSR
jgi:hypothetical protein